MYQFARSRTYKSLEMLDNGGFRATIMQQYNRDALYIHILLVKMSPRDRINNRHGLTLANCQHSLY